MKTAHTSNSIELTMLANKARYNLDMFASILLLSPFPSNEEPLNLHAD